jgi:hypothetical protein
LPEKITIDKSGANTAAIESAKADTCANIELRQCKYLNNIVEQDHRAIKRITRPMLGFKSFWSARIIIAGIETMHMIRKEQLDCPVGQAMSAADQFYTLAIRSPTNRTPFLGHALLIATEPDLKCCAQSKKISNYQAVCFGN